MAKNGSFSLEGALDTITTEIRRNSILIEILDDKMVKLAEGQELLHERMDRLEERVSAIELRLTNLEIKVDYLAERVDQLEVKVDRLEVKIDRLAAGVGQIEERLIRVETNQDMGISFRN